MSQLIIGQTQRLGRLALVPPVAAEVMFEDRALVRVHGRPQILDGVQAVKPEAMTDTRLKPMKWLR